MDHSRLGRPTHTSIKTLAIDPRTRNTLYTDGKDGIYKSTNGGSSWNLISTDLASYLVKVLTVDPVTPTTLYAGIYGLGVYKSTDGGMSWYTFDAGMTQPK